MELSSARSMGPAFRQWLGTGPGVAVADDVALPGSGQVAAFSPARWDHLLPRVFAALWDARWASFDRCRALPPARRRSTWSARSVARTNDVDGRRGVAMIGIERSRTSARWMRASPVAIFQ